MREMERKREMQHIHFPKATCAYIRMYSIHDGMKGSDGIKE